MAGAMIIRWLSVRYLRIVIPQIELSGGSELAGSSRVACRRPICGVRRVAKVKKSGAARLASTATAPVKKRSFEPDRKGESSAGALASKDKKRAVAASRGVATTR